MTQMTITPETPLHFDEMPVSLDNLPSNEELIGPEPSADLISSVRHWGAIFEPVLLSQRDGRYVVLGGRRRIKAARAIGLKEVPARITSLDSINSSTAVISLHATRKDNVAAELKAILEMMGTGLSEKDVAERTGLPMQTIRKRLKLCNLHETILTLLYHGLVPASVAERAASLPMSAQNELVGRMEEREDKALTMADIDDVRRTQVKETTMSLPFDRIEGVPSASQKDAISGKDDIVNRMLGSLGNHVEGRNTKLKWTVADKEGKRFLVQVSLKTLLKRRSA